jgi:hypothetical protein
MSNLNPAVSLWHSEANDGNRAVKKRKDIVHASYGSPFVQNVIGIVQGVRDNPRAT